MPLDEEEWRKVPGFPAYSVSSLGRVRRDWAAQGTQPGRILKPQPDRVGYPIVYLSIAQQHFRRPVHRLVALAFIGEPPTPKHEVAHGDGVKTNNAPSNLRWATKRENEADKLLHGSRRGDGKHCRKMGAGDRRRIEIMRAYGASYRKISEAIGLSVTAVGDYFRGKTYADVR